MPKTITVKGIGKATEQPDAVVLSMTIESSDSDYDRAMDKAAQGIEQLTAAVMNAGFEKKSLVTSSFNVRADYDNFRDGNAYKSVFRGYAVTHGFKLTFDLDMQALSRVLTAISESPVNPQLSIYFTVKDTAAVSEEMLRSAAEDARRKAEILCNASGVRLGELISIDYSWGELNVRSDTRCDCFAEGAALKMPRAIDIEPQAIETSETAAFVWEIL